MTDLRDARASRIRRLLAALPAALVVLAAACGGGTTADDVESSPNVEGPERVPDADVGEEGESGGRGGGESGGGDPEGQESQPYAPRQGTGPNPP